VLTNKYAEGCPHKRYYGRCEHVDAIEELAISPGPPAGSGRPGQRAAPQRRPGQFPPFFWPCAPAGDTILGMDLSTGAISPWLAGECAGSGFKAVHYGVSPNTEHLDFGVSVSWPWSTAPSVIICGYSAYPRTIEFRGLPRHRRRGRRPTFCGTWPPHRGLRRRWVPPSPIPHLPLWHRPPPRPLRAAPRRLILTNDATSAASSTKRCFPGSQGGAAGACGGRQRWPSERRSAQASGPTGSRWWPTPGPAER